MRTLFLQAPTFDGFDGGAGSRYQAKREIKSFWYPTWLAQPAALVPNSKLIAGLIGAKVAVDAAGAMAQAPVVDFCARNEFDFTVKEVADGVPMSQIKGL